jgi:hypothetical protein
MAFIVASLAVGLTTAIAAARAQSGAPASGVKMAEEVYKNIQVLKGVPAEQIPPTMQLIAASLGTQCSHCHVSGANEKDDKTPKEFARIMMKMVFDLNKNTFGDRMAVTCFTCHQGKLRPVGTMEPADLGRRSPAPGLVGGQPSADQMLSKLVQALGGEAAIAKITTRLATGTLESGANLPSPVEIYVKFPDKRLVVTHISGDESRSAAAGSTGWTSSAARGLRDMSAADVETNKLEDDLYLAATARKTYQWRVASSEKVGDKDAYVLNGSAQGHVPLRIYLDQQTGLLLRLAHFLETPFGRLPTQLDYDDYRDVDGVKVPFRISTIRPNTRYTIQLNQVQQNVPVEDARFAKPAAPATPGGRQQ